ncbi:MAG TPA: hypothetical protein VL132_11945 [Planctomycetaceae bacterium]|nr:hypothetical protein [Planctomycetaceae bacterium]
MPIRFDPDLNEFSLDYDCNEGRASHMMRYCFWCGGRLPKSRRGGLFTKPSRSETSDVRSKLSNATTFAELITTLGPPDQDFESGSEDVARQVTYTRLWTTLDLIVFELPDGSFDFALAGKFKGQIEPNP